MALRKVYRKKRPAYRKKKYIRKPRRNMITKPKPGTLLFKSNPGIPDRALLKFKYRDNYILTNSVQATSQRSWRLNSLYDPDYTGGGHQPLGYDQWSAFFQTYRVYKVTVDIDLVNEESVATQVLWTVQPDDPLLTGDDSSFEQPHTYSCILAGNGGQNRAKIRRTMLLPRYIGLSSAQYKANSIFSAPFSSNPSSVIYGILLVQSIDGSTLPNVAVNINMIFHSELFDRKELTVSLPAAGLPEAPN